MAKHWLIYNLIFTKILFIIVFVFFCFFDILYFEFWFFSDYIFHVKYETRKTQDDHFRKVKERSFWFFEF